MSNKTTQEAIEEFKALLEKGASLSAEDQLKLEKVEKQLDKDEIVNQKNLAAMQALQKSNEEFTKTITSLEEKLKDGVAKADYEALKKQIEDMDAQMSRPGFGKSGAQVSPEMKNFELAILKGREAEGLDLKYLRTDSNPDGGFLVPDEMSNELIKKITEISPMRQICRVKRTTAKTYIQPVRTTLVSGNDVGEGENSGNSNSTYGEVEITPHKRTAVVPITHEMLSDSAFEMETEIMEDVQEDFAQSEGFQAILGFASNNQMNGFLNNSKIDLVASDSGVAGTIIANDLITLGGELKRGYTPLYIFNRRTLATLRKFQGGDGQYIWAANLAAGAPNTINGEPYMLMEDMPDLASSSKSIAYGDWRRGYCIVDRLGITVIRDQFTLASDGKVRFILSRRVGGDVLLPEAIKILTTSTGA